MRVHPQNRGNGRSLTPDSTRHRSAHLPGSRNSRALAGAVTPATGHGQRRQSRMVSPRTEPGSSRRTSLSAKSHSPPQPFRPADTGSRGSSLVPGATAAPGPRLRVHAQVPLERFLQTPFAVAARRRDLRCRQLPPPIPRPDTFQRPSHRRLLRTKIDPHRCKLVRRRRHAPTVKPSPPTTVTNRGSLPQGRPPQPARFARDGRTRRPQFHRQHR